MKNSKSVRILDLIASHPEGMRFREIQKALWDMSKPFGVQFTNEVRGWWCTGLLGSYYSGPGLLRFFCTKDPNTKRWVRNDVPHEDAPWKVMRTAWRCASTPRTW